ncbi:Membrane-associated phospholipid phosphatase [Halapricum desulfuricans]|uniref:Membrane-associated phospholipid phosphatase n=1 Tax=Halapricum desulfuricans TaxID=2841257 RepID=A0A897NDY4_9EURY|nr:phosphatase PAP2 family protein [Halapricum desulfuricans]QSG10624.1 Membrane-associated phospholipid phosphatase [Halapricum desulfuricans]
MRGIGLPSLLAELFGPLVVVFALLTQLGDTWFLFALVVSSYWFGPHTPRIGDGLDRRRGAIVVGLLLLAFVLVYTTKPLFGLPRPPSAAVPPRGDLVPDALAGVYEWLSTSSGFGFPSGHATGSTLVYGGLAWAVRISSPRRRAVIAAVLITVVSLSRLALGVHYLVDVLAGTALALTGLAVAVRLATPRRVFGLAAAVGFIGLIAVGPTPDLLASTAMAVGATVVWTGFGDELLATPSRAGALSTAGVGAVVVVLGGGLALLVRTDPLLSGGGALLVGAGIVAMPLVGDRVAKTVAAQN